METIDYKKLAQEALEDHRKARVYNFRLFLKKKLAVSSALVLVIIVVSALFAPWVAPYPDQGKGAVNLKKGCSPFPKSISWGPMFMVVIFLAGLFLVLVFRSLAAFSS